MKNFTSYRKSVTGRIAFVLLMMASSLAWAQPTVTVPATAQVVVAGTGGTTGFGGTVGSGGVVIMPDPGSGSFTINPNSTTLTSYSVSGDLSFSSSLLVQAGTANSSPQSIYSFNKAVRQSEVSGLARSKGRVTVGYVASACGGAISFDIYKKYSGGSIVPTNPNYVPPIVGPDCWLPGETYTYSVDQIASDNLGDGIGIDEYYWTISNGSTTLTNFYTSADKSSITFAAPSLITGSWSITCCYGRANPWDGNSSGTHTTCVTKAIGSLPIQPAFSTAPPTCLPTGAGSFSVILQPSSINTSYTYTWAAPGTSWTLTQGGTQNANLNVTGLDNNPGTLTLTIVGDCEPSVFTYEINRNFTSAIAISGSTCVSAGTTNSYTLPTNALLNDTTWSLPGGWSIVGSNSTDSTISVLIPASAPAGAYTLSAKSIDCPSTFISLVVNVRPATPVFVTTSGQSPTCVTRNGGPAVTYTINAVPGATSYQWTFPAGWSPASATTATPTVSVTPGGTTQSGTVTVTVIGTNGCNTTATRPVNYTSITPNSITASCWSIGIAGQTTITVANAPSPFYGNYTVTSSPSGLFTSYSVNASTGVITLNTSASATPGTYNLTITHVTGGTCAPTPVVFPVTVSGNTAVFNNPTITGGSFDPSPGGCDTYTVINATAGSTYQWFINGSNTPLVANGTTVFLSPAGNSLSLCGSSSTPTSVCVVVTNGTCKTKLCAPLVGTHSARMANPKGGKNTIEGVSVYPNPAKGDFFIKIDNFKESASAVISDSNGKNIGTFKLNKGENKINIEGRAKGVYTVLLTIDGERTTRNIIIE